MRIGGRARGGESADSGHGGRHHEAGDDRRARGSRRLAWGADDSHRPRRAALRGSESRRRCDRRARARQDAGGRGAERIDVPLTVDVGIGENWKDAASRNRGSETPSALSSLFIPLLFELRPLGPEVVGGDWDRSFLERARARCHARPACRDHCAARCARSGRKRRPAPTRPASAVRPTPPARRLARARRPTGQYGGAGAARLIGAELLPHAVANLLIDPLALDVAARPGVAVEGARPPVEHALPRGDVRQETQRRAGTVSSESNRSAAAAPNRTRRRYSASPSPTTKFGALARGSR